MTSPTDKLWASLDAGKNDEVIQLIKSNPNLVNSVSKRNTTVLVSVAYSDAPSMKLVEFLLGHADFNPTHKPEGANLSNIDAILDFHDPKLLTLVINNSKLYISKNQSTGKDQSTYEIVANRFESTNKGYDLKMKRDPNPEKHKKIKENADNYQKMMVMLRDATIRHAIKTDDDNLFELLDKAGAKPMDALSDGKMPADLLPKRNAQSKVYNWFMKAFDASMKKTTTALTSANDNSFFNPSIAKLEQIEQQKKDLLARKLQADTAAVTKGLKDMTALAQTIQTSVK